MNTYLYSEELKKDEIMKTFCLVGLMLGLLFCVSCASVGVENVPYDTLFDVSGGADETAASEPIQSRAQEVEITAPPIAETLIETKVETECATEAVTEIVTEQETVVETQPEIQEIKLGYVAPEGWYQPRFETGIVEGGDYPLYYDVMGLKVTAVQRALGIAQTGYYRQTELDMIAFFQCENGIEASGEVDLATWLALGLNENDWYTLGNYVTPVAIEPGFTRDEITKKFVECAKSYVKTKTPYIVGASGKPGQGVDCSGLVLQCMYAIGIYPDGLDPVQHSTEEEYNSRLMWADPKLKRIDRGDILPGDLVFYTRPGSSSVCHVAVYVGDDECIEALTRYVEYLPVDKDDYGYAIKGFKRIISE